MVELVGLRRAFPGSPPVVALDGVDLVVPRGDYVSIVGASGSGKSTLLHLLGCLDQPSGGRYLLDGVDVGRLSETERTAQRAQRIGFVFQSFHLLPHRSALENVMLAGLYDRSDRRTRRDRAVRALERVGLSHRRDFPPSTLSGGERQRVAIARAISGNPSLLLCDEPTGNLDSANTAAVLDLFDELRADGLTLVVITHDDGVSARADRVVRMVDGVLHADAEWAR